LNEHARTYVKIQIHDLSLSFSITDPYSHAWFVPRLGAGRLHERPVTTFLLRQLKGTRCFVDVGTNLGWYTCLASKILPEGHVFGFEMDYENYLLTLKNLRLNRCANVTVYPFAVGDRSGTTVYRSPVSVSESSYRSRFQLCSKDSNRFSRYVIDCERIVNTCHPKL